MLYLQHDLRLERLHLRYQLVLQVTLVPRLAYGRVQVHIRREVLVGHWLLQLRHSVRLLWRQLLIRRVCLDPLGQYLLFLPLLLELPEQVQFLLLDAHLVQLGDDVAHQRRLPALRLVLVDRVQLVQHLLTQLLVLRLLLEYRLVRSQCVQLQNAAAVDFLLPLLQVQVLLHLQTQVVLEPAQRAAQHAQVVADLPDEPVLHQFVNAVLFRELLHLVIVFGCEPVHVVDGGEYLGDVFLLHRVLHSHFAGQCAEVDLQRYESEHRQHYQFEHECLRDGAELESGVGVYQLVVMHFVYRQHFDEVVFHQVLQQTPVLQHQ